MHALAILVLAAVLGNFGQERPIDAVQRLDLSPEGKVAARVAVNESGSLVIWTDHRTGAAELYAARMDRDGTLLDPTGRLVAAGGYSGDVVWTGRAWLLAYGLEGWVYVRTMTPDGILGAPQRAVQVDWIAPLTVRMATTGTTVAIVTNAGKGAVLSVDGDVRRTFTLERSESHHEFTTDVAVANGLYGIAYLTPAGVTFQRIDTLSNELAILLPDSSGASSVAIASDGSAFMIVYSATNLRAQKINAGGAREGERRTLTNFVQPASGEPAARFPSLVWRGGDYLLTFSRGGGSDAASMRVSRDGEPLSAPLTFTNVTRPSDPHLDVRSDGSGVVVWVFGKAVRAAFFEASSAAPERERELSFSVPAQRNVQVASNGSSFFTGWVETTSRGAEIRLARNFGEPSITVPTGASPTLFDVLADGDVLWVVYSGSGGLHARRFTTDLKPVDAEAVTLSRQTGSVRVAAGGGAIAAVWSHGTRFTAIAIDIATPAGERFEVQRLTIGMETAAENETIAWNGREFVVAWAQATQGQWWQMPELVPEHLHAVRVGADAIVRDPVPLVLSDEPAMHITRIEQNGAAIAWQSEKLLGGSYWTIAPDGAKTSVVRFDGSERPLAHNAVGLAPRTLRAVTTLGENLLVIGGAQYVLLSSALEPLESGTLPVPVEDFDVASVRGEPVLVYSRIVREPQTGGVHRVFIRTPAEMPHRRRAVR